MMGRLQRTSPSTEFHSQKRQPYSPIHCHEQLLTHCILKRNKDSSFSVSQACNTPWLWCIPIVGIPLGSSAPEERHQASEKIMSEETNEEVEMLDEYDFSDGVIGKYAKQYAEGTNIVVLEPDVAKVFPDSAAVNQALRQLIEQRSR
jgi:hypothetical protein